MYQENTSKIARDVIRKIHYESYQAIWQNVI